MTKPEQNKNALKMTARHEKKKRSPLKPTGTRHQSGREYNDRLDIFVNIKWGLYYQPERSVAVTHIARYGTIIEKITARHTLKCRLKKKCTKSVRRFFSYFYPFFFSSFSLFLWIGCTFSYLRCTICFHTVTINMLHRIYTTLYLYFFFFFP